MRSAPAARPGIGRPPIEFRVRFPNRMKDAGPAESNSAGPQHQPRQASAASGDFWQTDAGRELRADRERIEAVLGQLRTSVDRYRDEQTKRLNDWQNAAVELAATIATRLLHQRVTANEFAIEAKVRDMIAQLGEDAPMSVHLNPADVALLESRLSGEPLLPGKDDPRIVPDPSLGRSECRVEGREAMLLSELTREVQEIRDELLRSLTHAGT